MSMNFCLEKYWNPIFIETGTRSGDSVNKALLARFKKIYSIELDAKFYERNAELDSKRKFKREKSNCSWGIPPSVWQIFCSKLTQGLHSG